MTLFNFGSINIDHVYDVAHFVRPGETLTSNHYRKVLGGKGANQSIALAKAGCPVHHVGAIAESDSPLLEQLQQAGVDTNHVALLSVPTGHAIIQVNQQAENAIVLFPGANHALTTEQIAGVLATAAPDDWVLLQNETNHIGAIITSAKQQGLTVAYNPAPMNKALVEAHLADIDVLIVNEVEAMDLLGVNTIEAARESLQRHYPQLTILMTLGAEGVCHIHNGYSVHVPAFKVDAVDTTAAGDTFIGYCLAALMQDIAIDEALRRACAASAICVTREGASIAIPTPQQVDDFLQVATHDA